MNILWCLCTNADKRGDLVSHKINPTTHWQLQLVWLRIYLAQNVLSIYLLVGTIFPPLIMHFMAMMCVACDYINGSMDEIGLGFQLMPHSISHACHLQRISTMR